MALTRHDFLELAAALAGLAGIRNCFISYGAANFISNGRWWDCADGALPERTVALARASLYNFLGVNFAEPPTALFVENLCRSGALALLADKGLGDESLRDWGDDVEAKRRAAELAAAYTRLFIRPGASQIACVASHYLCSNYDQLQSLTWGPAAEAAAAAYREAGLIVAGDGPCSPDHLAVELQFMRHCAAREAAAWGNVNAGEAEVWRRRQSDFLAAHLLPWTGAFAARVRDVGGHAYYRALARLLDEYLIADAEGLARSLAYAYA